MAKQEFITRGQELFKYDVYYFELRTPNLLRN